MCTSLENDSALNRLIKTSAVGLALHLQEAKGFHNVFNAEDFYWLALQDSTELVKLGVTLVAPMFTHLSLHPHVPCIP